MVDFPRAHDVCCLIKDDSFTSTLSFATEAFSLGKVKGKSAKGRNLEGVCMSLPSPLSRNVNFDKYPFSLWTSVFLLIVYKLDLLR